MNLDSTSLAIFLSVAASACASPGSRIGHLAVQGSITNANGVPLRKETVEFILPAEYGLDGLDRYFAEPKDYGHSGRKFSVATEEGEFRHELGTTLFHTTMWLIPPLGMLPRNPPPLFLLIRLPRMPDEYYAVQTWDGRYKAFRSDGTEIQASAARLVELEAAAAKDEAADGPATVGWIGLRVRESLDE